MTKVKFRRPEEMTQDEPKDPISARVPRSTKACLQKEAKKVGISIGALIGNVLEDYVRWINEEK